MRRSLRTLIIGSALICTALSSNLFAAPPSDNIYQQIVDYWAAPIMDALKPEVLQQMITPTNPEETKPYLTVDGTAKISWAERIKQKNQWRQKSLIEVLPPDAIFRINQGERSDHVFTVSDGMEGLDPTNPDVAYDSVNQRYLMVWEEETSPGVFNIMGQFRDREGRPVGTAALISSARTTHGCFFANFDTENGAITTPRNCPKASNPSVAYNNGRYIIVWELKGRAEIAHNLDGTNNDSGKNFSNIIGKVVNAENLQPATPAWSEGLLISSASIASNVRRVRATNDSQIQAWSQSLNPDVAPKVGGDGFVVTWQTDRDFIRLISPDRRASSSIYARYIDQAFAPGNAANKQAFLVYADPSVAISECPVSMTNCNELTNVMKAVNARIAYNSNRSDYVVVFELARARGATKGDIAAKKIVLNGSNDATVTNNTVAEIVADASEGSTFRNPDISSYAEHTLLAYDDGSNVFAKRFTTNATVVVTPTEAATNVSLGGSGAKTEPRIGTNLEVGGTRTSPSAYPERVLLAYRQGDAMKWAVADSSFTVVRGPASFPVMATANRQAEIASDSNNFFVAWAGTPPDSAIENVFGAIVNTLDDFAAPVLVTPAAGATLNERAVTLTWNAVAGTGVVYDVYFGVGTAEPTIVSTAQTTTTYNAMSLAYGSSYRWRVIARDSARRTSVSETRMFSLVDGLGAPTLLTPANGAMILESSVNLTWGPVSGTGIVYDVYFGEGAGEPAISRSNLSVTNLTVPVMPGRAYRWRVVAKDSLMRSAGSDPRSFSTIPAFSAMVTLTAPANGAVVPTDSVSLTWMAVAGTGVVYDVYHATGAGALAIVSPGQVATNYTIRGMTSQSVHQWKVIARDSLRRTSESAVRMFTVGNLNMPTAPILSAQPADNATWAPTRLALSWMGSTDADLGDTVTYDVYFEEVAGAMSPLPADAIPYRSGIAVGTTSFIIQASTDNRAQYRPNGMHAATQTFLEPNSHYAWKVCANDGRNNPVGVTCSPVRHFNTDNSVVGWWRFDENPAGMVCPGVLGGPAGDAGETVCDYSGFGNHGRPNGAPMWLAPDPMLLGGALRFDGVDDWVEVQDNISLNVNSGLTISCKLNLQRIAINTAVLTKDSPAAGPFAFNQTNANQLSFAVYTLGWNRTFGDINPLLGTTIRASGIYDGISANLYFGTALQQSTLTPGTVSNNLNFLVIGKNPFNMSYYAGIIDECLILNKAFDAFERFNLVGGD